MPALTQSPHAVAPGPRVPPDGTSAGPASPDARGNAGLLPESHDRMSAQARASAIRTDTTQLT